MNGIVKTYPSDRVVYVLKRCSTCGKRKPLEAFSPDKRRPYGVNCRCKDCCNLHQREVRSTEEGRAKRRIEHVKYLLDPAHRENKKRVDERSKRTPNGVITTLFIFMKRRSKKRKHAPPKFTKVQLTKWLYDNGFQKLYDDWVSSGYNRWKKPSCDRLDDSKGYSFDNMRLVTWKENHDKNKRELEKKSRKAVQQIDLDGTVTREWASITQAKKELGFDVGNALRRKYLAKDGYYYVYKV